MLTRIQAVLEDAEEKQMSNRLVKMWLDDLKDLAYDVEDILDEFATESLQRKLKGEPQPQAVQTSFENSCILLLDNFTQQLANTIVERMPSAKDIASEMGNLINLRHLDIANVDLEEMAVGVKELKNLQTLSNFVVGKDSSGADIVALKDLKFLEGHSDFQVGKCG
ncbi:hypothetical protein GH714_004199 [Hevea brasiliensis]|uniref:Disease resistance N-terminal domain-containing protein n=1 Tax=Hevea brasiliensis TaxID=3981 RepID=A0A6A6L025_HEVBR|nr:hypothetical protein GH714_004199 [Hevea brasiliensis]